MANGHQYVERWEHIREGRRAILTAMGSNLCFQWAIRLLEKGGDAQ